MTTKTVGLWIRKRVKEHKDFISPGVAYSQEELAMERAAQAQCQKCPPNEVNLYILINRKFFISSDNV